MTAGCFDGGLVNPVPISVCRALGADIVLAVNLNGELIGRHSAKKKPKENKEGEGDFVERIAMTIRQYGTTLFGENESPAHHRRASSAPSPVPWTSCRTGSPGAAWPEILQTSF